MTGAGPAVAVLAAPGSGAVADVGARSRSWARLPPLLVGGVAALGLALIWPQLGQAGAGIRALAHARWWWLPPIVALSSMTYVMSGLAMLGASACPLPRGRTIVAQLAAAFTNRLAPAGLGGMATNVRFLERAGSTRPQAAAAVALSSAAGFIVHAVVVLAVLPLRGLRGIGLHLHGPDVLEYWPALVVVAALPAAFGPRLNRRRTQMPATGALAVMTASLGSVLRTPRRVAALFLGSMGVTAGYALALLASVQAFGGGVAPLRVVAVYLAGSAVAAVSPTPGGLGALEVALVAGLTTAGSPGPPAVGAVLVFRFTTYWLPVLPGWVAFRWLRAVGSL